MNVRIILCSDLKKTSMCFLLLQNKRSKMLMAVEIKRTLKQRTANWSQRVRKDRLA